LSCDKKKKKKKKRRRGIRKPLDNTFTERNDDDDGKKAHGTTKLLHPPNDTRVRVFPKLLFKRRNPFFVFFFDERERRGEQILFRL
jgi:hypothetical protein|tara:strand:+ start:119 stop:376 length:258 start_codon:yes stop_codon:yes gene_type:complete